LRDQRHQVYDVHTGSRNSGGRYCILVFGSRERSIDVVVYNDRVMAGPTPSYDWEAGGQVDLTIPPGISESQLRELLQPLRDYLLSKQLDLCQVVKEQ
jgi:hypothetical protein